jgi:hypothetical protein
MAATAAINDCNLYFFGTLEHRSDMTDIILNTDSAPYR